MGIDVHKNMLAYCILTEKKIITEDEVKALCKERLAGYKHPKKIVFLDDLPKNLYGKVMRKELRKRFQNE